MTAWLLTWLWQGTALAGVIAVLLRCARHVNAATKHATWCAVLVGIVWLGWVSSPHLAVTALKGCATDTAARGLQASGDGGTGLQPCLADAAQAVFYIPSAPEFLLTIGMGIWAAVALVNLVRLIPALHAMYAVRDRCRPFPARLEARLPRWRETKDRGRRPQLMTCDAIAGATLLGLHAPCIAIPSSLIDALSPDELDQVVLHEYAHVQRRDDWVRLAQSLMLSALWIHPAAIFVSRAINREREMACDEWVVARTGLPKAYAQCLARAAELRMSTRATPPLLSAFLGNRQELDRRVDRLLAMRGKTRRGMSRAGIAVAAGAIAAIAVSVQGARFGEIGTIVLPHVATPAFARVATTPSLPEVTAISGPKPATRSVARKASTFAANTEIATLDTPTSAPDGATAGTPNAPLASPVLHARAFEAQLDAPNARNAPAPNATKSASNWRSIAAPGIEIAAAARKTSVGLANVFSRAGVSLARSF